MRGRFIFFVSTHYRDGYTDPLGICEGLQTALRSEYSTVRRFLLKNSACLVCVLAFPCSAWFYKSFSTLNTFVVFHLQINFQRWQWYPCINITPLCLFMCTDSCWLCVNCFGQRVQWKSLIPRWIFSCDFRTCWSKKDLPQPSNSHLNCLSAVCLTIWRFR